MTTRALIISTALGAALLGAPAFAGEITGNGQKEDYSMGASICKFSGQNDDPLGLDPENGPGGVSQSYGQDVKLGIFSPLDPDDPHPGTLCNPNNVPMKDIGGPNH